MYIYENTNSFVQVPRIPETQCQRPAQSDGNKVTRREGVQWSTPVPHQYHNTRIYNSVVYIIRITIKESWLEKNQDHKKPENMKKNITDTFIAQRISKIISLRKCAPCDASVQMGSCCSWSNLLQDDGTHREWIQKADVICNWQWATSWRLQRPIVLDPKTYIPHSQTHTHRERKRDTYAYRQTARQFVYSANFWFYILCSVWVRPLGTFFAARSMFNVSFQGQTRRQVI